MFEFTDDCLIGIEELDNEHRYLFELINEGISLLQNEYLYDRYEQIKAILERLENYADEHFAHEEAYMEQICDPELIIQRTQHASFREHIRSFTFTDIDDPEEQQKLLEELMNYMAKWLYHHIIGSDILINKLPPLEEWMVKENPCEFTEEYRLGIPLIDKEHEVLFHIVDKANKLVRCQNVAENIDELDAILAELAAYTKEHFSDEEEYMENIHYEGLAAQKRAHAAFIDKVTNIDLSQLTENPQEYAEGLIEFLLGWLINHILYSDKKIPLH